MKKKIKFPFFLLFYICFVAALCVFWVKVIQYVNDCLLRFEAAQPERLVEIVTERIEREGANSVFGVKEAFTRYETVDFIAKRYDDSVAGKEITWKQDKVNYDPTAPVYRFYADGEHIGTITLREVSSEQLMIFLSLSEWEIASAEPVLESGHQSVEITVPDSCSVRVNGELLGAQESTGEETIPDQFKYVQEYVAVPKLVGYRVDGLLEKPIVEVRDASGQTVECKESYQDGVLSVERSEFPVSEMEQELADLALENAKRYTNFQSEDLPGCHASTKPIADMFPEDSIYMEQAERYRLEDMWMYNNHSAPVFRDESVSEYMRYTEDLFSCDVYFNKDMVLVRGGSLKTETFHMRLFYGLLDGKWKILDMQTLTD